MFASNVERRFYRAFFRWHNIIVPSNHVARDSRRPFSSSAARRIAIDDETTPSHQLIPTAQPTTSTQESQQQSAADGDQDIEESIGDGPDSLGSVPFRSLVRTVFRSVAHPVAIVTALAPESADDRFGLDGSFDGMQHNEWENVLKSLRAMTISSLNTVSLDPTPVISFNVRVPSSTWDAIRTRRRFRVSLLRSTKKACMVAELFSKGDAMQGYRILLGSSANVTLHKPGSMLKVGNGSLHWKVAEKNVDPNPAPFIKSRAFAFHLDVDLRPEQCMQVNDHVIVVADVTHVLRASRSVPKVDKTISRMTTLSYLNHEFVRADRPVVRSSTSDEESSAVVDPKVRVSQPPKGYSFRRVQAGNNDEQNATGDLDKHKRSSEQNSAMNSSTVNRVQVDREQQLLEALRIKRVSG